MEQNEALEALRNLGVVLGDLEIDENTLLPKFVLSGNRAKNYKIVEDALIKKQNLEECLKGIENYLDLRIEATIVEDEKKVFIEIKNHLNILKDTCLGEENDKKN